MKVFLAVAEEKNITKAAQRLGYVQSNVTARIRQLESELNTSLLYRHARGVSLTPTGETVLSYAKKIITLCSQVKCAVQDESDPIGPLRIGSMETTAAIRLPELLTEYHETYPKVDLFLTTGPTEQLLQSVLEYKIDGAFVAAPIEHPEIVQETFVEEELVLISSSKKSPILTLQNIQEQTLLVFRTGCTYRSQLKKWLHDEGIYPEKIMEFGTLDAILGCVRAGLGFSLVPKSVIEHTDPDSSITYHDVPDKYGKVKTIFIRRQDSLITPALYRFLQHIRDYFSKRQRAKNTSLVNAVKGVPPHNADFSR